MRLASKPIKEASEPRVDPKDIYQTNAHPAALLLFQKFCICNIMANQMHRFEIESWNIPFLSCCMTFGRKKKKDC